MSFEKALESLGSFGRWQQLNCAIIYVVLLSLPMLELNQIFILFPSDFRCKVPKCDQTGNATYNDADEFGAFTIPYWEDSYDDLEIDQWNDRSCQHFAMQNISDYSMCTEDNFSNSSTGNEEK